MANQQKQVVLVNAEPKKHSVLFKAKSDEKDPPLTSAYIMRSAFPNGVPPKVTITISWDE